jgi:hypothetical protein
VAPTTAGVGIEEELEQRTESSPAGSGGGELYADAAWHPGRGGAPLGQARAFIVMVASSSRLPQKLRRALDRRSAAASRRSHRRLRP